MTSKRTSKKYLSRAYENYDKLHREYKLDELSPSKAVHWFCKKCTFDPSLSIKNCGGEGGDGFKKCQFYDYRMGSLNGSTEKELLRKISKYCQEECCDGKKMMEMMCQGRHCPLYFYRYGKNPKRQKSAKRNNNLPEREEEMEAEMCLP